MSPRNLPTRPPKKLKLPTIDYPYPVVLSEAYHLSASPSLKKRKRRSSAIASPQEKCKKFLCNHLLIHGFHVYRPIYDSVFCKDDDKIIKQNEPGSKKGSFDV